MPRRDLNSGRGEMFSQFLREGDRFRRIAVDADRVRLNRDVAAVDRSHNPLAQHAERAFGCFLRIMQERIRPPTGDERPVGQIISVGKNLSGDAEVERFAGPFERASSRCEKEKRSIHGQKGVDHSIGHEPESRAAML